MTNPVSNERLLNTLNWARARVGQLSGAEVIVGAIEELLGRRANEPCCPCGTLLLRVEGGFVPACDCAVKNAVSVEPECNGHPFRAYVDFGNGERIFATGETIEKLIEGLRGTDLEALRSALNRPAPTEKT